MTAEGWTVENGNAYYDGNLVTILSHGDPVPEAALVALIEERDRLQDAYDELRDNIADPYAQGVQAAFDSLHSDLDAERAKVAEAVALLSDVRAVTSWGTKFTARVDAFLADANRKADQ